MRVLLGRVPWGDSFQELARIWGERGYCEIGASDDRFSWAVTDNGKKILLHEHDRVENLPEYEKGLFANEVPEGGAPWIYWPRHSRVLRASRHNILPEQDRKIESIFIGAAENPIQYVNRTNFDWDLAVEHFEFKEALFQKDYHVYDKADFLQAIKKAKFGLCLPGYGPKCQREIEYMAHGVVPIFTWDTFNDYHNPLKENVHFLKAKNPREVREIISSTDKKKFKEMSQNCLDWFQENCSIEGSFKLTERLINEP